MNLTSEEIKQAEARGREVMAANQTVLAANVGWTDEARAKSLEARRRHAKEPGNDLKKEDNWNTFAPGTGAKDQNANSFQKEVPGGNLRGNMVQYNINPNSRGKFDLSSAGHPSSPGLWQNHGTFNTHLQAMKAASEHYTNAI